MRDEIADGVTLDCGTVAARTEDLDIVTTELRGFEDRLAAAAARCADRRIGSSGHCDPRHLVQSELMLGGGQSAIAVSVGGYWSRLDPAATDIFDGHYCRF